MHFVLLCAWALCVVVAFLGYGKLLLGILRFQDAPWALAAAIGVTVFVTAGGVLNIFDLATTPVLIGVVAGGVVLALALDWHHLPSLPATLLSTSVLYAPLVIAAAIPVLGNVTADIRTFNPIDDFPAYLTIPAATHDLGSLPFDPFSERRITSCLGAPYVLQSLMLVAGDVRSIRFIDVSLGFVLYTGLLLTIFRMMGLPVPLRVGLAFLALLVPVDRWNATMVVLPAALFCVLLLIQIHPNLGARLNWRRTVLLGMTAAALGCMKSNYLPTSVAICGFYYAAWLVYRRRAAPLLQGLLWAAVLIVCMLPWMIDMQRKEGTLLFPVFGRGYDASAFGAIPLPSGSHGDMGSAALWVWLTTLPMAAPLVIALGGLALAFRKRVEGVWINPLAAMLAGSVVGIAAIGSSTGGESIGRYCLPFQLPALIIFLGFLIACRRDLRQWTWWMMGSGAAAVVALVVFAVAFGVRHHDYERYLEDARLANFPAKPRVNLQREEQRVRDLQARVPAGERILARLYLTYSFDFRRNEVFVADYSGMAGLPPGMPIEGGPGQMREYLLSHGIRYLAYDPKRTMFDDEAPEASLQSLLHGERDYGRHGWLVLQIKVSNAVQATFAQLAEQCLHVYDDGLVYVLDLRTMKR